MLDDFIQRSTASTRVCAVRYINGRIHRLPLFPRYWPFVRGIHWSPVNSPHKCQWPRALMFSLICAWMNGWVKNDEAGDLRCRRSHYDVIVMDITSSGVICHFLHSCNCTFARTIKILIILHYIAYIYLWQTSSQVNCGEEVLLKMNDSQRI